MGLKEKLLQTATTKVAKHIVNSGSVDNAINTAINKLGKLSGMKTTDEVIKNVSQKNYLIIKARSFSVSSIAGMFKDKTPNTNDLLGRFQIVDKDGILKYKSEDKESSLLSDIVDYDREFLNVYDSSNKKIGSVKEWLVSIGVPLLEKEVKKCTIKIGNEKFCDLKKYESFGDLEFDTLYGDIKVSHKDKKDFTISHKGKKIAALHTVPINLKDGHADKFIIEYDDPEYEIIAVMVAIGIDIINV